MDVASVHRKGAGAAVPANVRAYIRGFFWPLLRSNHGINSDQMILFSGSVHCDAVAEHSSRSIATLLNPASGGL